MEILLYILAGALIGFFVSFVTLKSSLKKEGAGNCKMCQTCPYKRPPVVDAPKGGNPQ